MAAAGFNSVLLSQPENEVELYDIFVSCTPLFRDMEDLRDMELERFQEEAQRNPQRPADSSSSSSPLDMQMVVWGLPAVPLQEIAPREVVRRRGSRTARIPRSLRLKWHPKKKKKMDLAAKKARKDFQLPSGWAILVKTRSTGKTADRKDKFYVPPGGGKKYRSLQEVMRALKVI